MKYWTAKSQQVFSSGLAPKILRICDLKIKPVRQRRIEKITRSKNPFPTDFGEELSWEYLCYVRAHPLNWKVPTSILYGENDNITSIETMKDFAERHDANLTVMEGGEHWFHTEEEMKFLDEWIRRQSGFYSS